MEIISFVQGMLSVIGVLVIGGMVWALQKTKEIKWQLNDLKNGLTYLENQLSKTAELHDKDLQESSTDIYRYVDSRFDKFENKFLTQKNKN